MKRLLGIVLVIVMILTIVGAAVYAGSTDSGQQALERLDKKLAEIAAYPHRSDSLVDVAQELLRLLNAHRLEECSDAFCRVHEK